MKLFPKKDHFILAALAMFILFICSVATTYFSFLNPVSRVIYNISLSDIYYQIMRDSGKQQRNDLIVIVDATQLYDRSKIGELMEEVAACQPAVVGVDCIYEGFRGDTLGSNRLAEGIFSLQNAVYAFKMTDYNYEQEEYKTARHSFFADAEGVTEGYSNLRLEGTSVMARKLTTEMICNGDTVYSLPFQVARAFTPNVEEFASTQEFLIDYTPTDFPVVPCDSIAEYAHLLKDRIVYIGATHDDADMQFTPYGRTPGTIIQAYITQTILEGHRTVIVPQWIVMIISFIIVVLTDIMQTRLAAWTMRQKNLWVRFIFSSALTKNAINLCWLLVLMYLNFMLFYKFEYYFKPSILLVSVALLVEARLFYESGKEAYHTYRKERRAKKISHKKA